MQSFPRAVLTGMVLLLAHAASPALTPVQGTPQVVAPRIIANEARLPVQITRVTSDTEIAGRAARTRIALELRNPNDRVLEGELQFPLQPGQEVTGFALDIGGSLRPAVAVEKAKGRQVFDDVVRARVDPALLEATGGNNYKLRVYPLPPKGTRQVVLEIAEQLPRVQVRGADTLRFALPLQFGRAVQQIQVSVRVAGVQPQQVAAQAGALRLRATSDGQQGAWVTLPQSANNVAGGLQVTIRQPAASQQPRDAVTAGVFKGQAYFYADAAVETRSAPRPAPSKIAILWDASGSGRQRDHAAEFAVLQAWFRSVGNVAVHLQLLRDVPQDAGVFTVKDGDWRALRTALEQVAYDGATRLGAAAIPADAQEVLLFSDGLDNYGATSLATPGVPLHAFASGPGADARRLRNIAEGSGGAYVDIAQAEPAKAVQLVRTARTRIVGLRSSAAKDLVAASAYPESGRLAIAGRLTGPDAVIEVELEAPGGQRSTRRVAVRAPGADVSTQSLASWQWAALTLARLEADADRNSAAIRRLGMQFAMATRETSLIVLDEVADYARFEIEPPDALRPAYDRLVASAASKDSAARVAHRARVVQRFNAKIAWWEKDYPQDAPPPPPVPSPSAAAAMLAPAPAPGGARPAPAPAAAAAAPAPAPAAPAPPSASQRAADSSRPPGQPQAPSATIRLQKWEPDAPYARRLRAAPVDAMYGIYLDERPSYASSTAFYIDAADIFIERGERALGLRILSNLAEMELENRHILRILGYRLMQASDWNSALPVLRKVQRLAPDEPQSWRDLAQALAAAGRSQEAVDTLWQVGSRPWNSRFPDIELIVLAEMNALIARSAAQGTALDVSAIDPALSRNLPLDLRVVLTWDADNTDIDLHVVDPNGEEVYYGKPLSYQGGRVSSDFTNGYGPEEFALRKAKPGVYTVKARFYGHRQQIVAPATTLMLQLSTGFGTAGQKDQSTVLRLSGRGDMVTVGTFTVEPR